MDYSQVSDESSPWNTSPKASARATEPPTPPLGNSMYSSTSGSFPSPALSEGFRDGDDDEHGQQHDSQDAMSPAHSQPQQAAQPQHVPQAAQAQLGPEGQAPRQQSARFQTANRQAGRTGPQYKLHCKITALERTGKKEIILRFDAQVRTSHTIPWSTDAR